jgi:hypothetical protein
MGRPRPFCAGALRHQFVPGDGESISILVSSSGIAESADPHAPMHTCGMATLGSADSGRPSNQPLAFCEDLRPAENANRTAQSNWPKRIFFHHGIDYIRTISFDQP